MSDRVFAAAWFVVCVLIAVRMASLEIPFAYEPVGPKAFPVLLAVLMAGCCLVLLWRPDRDVIWPEPAWWARGAVLIALLLGYAGCFESLGYPLATLIVVFLTGLLFGGRWWSAAGTSLLAGIGGYFLFDRLLEVSLPLGRIWIGT